MSTNPPRRAPGTPYQKVFLLPHAAKINRMIEEGYTLRIIYDEVAGKSGVKYDNFVRIVKHKIRPKAPTPPEVTAHVTLIESASVPMSKSPIQPIIGEPAARKVFVRSETIDDVNKL